MLKKIDISIEIVSSSRAELSSMGSASREAVLIALKKYFTSVVITIVNTVEDLEMLKARQPDLVFLGMNFIPFNQEQGRQATDKIWLADYFDQNNINYTGSNQLAQEVELNKQLAKQRVFEAGLSTAAFCVVKPGQEIVPSETPQRFPLFVKPADLGGGAGIDENSVVHNFDELRTKVLSITSRYNSDALIEEYLSGREFSVAVLKNKQAAGHMVMPLELIAPINSAGVRILSAKVKSSDTERFVEVTDFIIKAQITALAIDVFMALGARDYGRIDIRLDENGKAHFLEANLLPSLLKDYGNFPKACMLNVGMSYEDTLLHIISLALSRERVALSDSSALVHV